MNLNELRYQIESSFTTCAQCDSRVDEWPDADTSDPGHQVIYFPRLRAFAGICPAGHMNEWTLDRAKTGETTPEDVTVRTIARFVKQDDCTHGKRTEVDLPAGSKTVTADGTLEGPVKIWMCMWCGRREQLTAKNKKTGIILP